MTRKKPKISYRDLMRGEKGGEPAAPPPAEPPPVASAAPPVTAAPIPASAHTTAPAPAAIPPAPPAPDEVPRDPAKYTTPRVLAAILNPGVRTPAGGIPAVPEPTAAPAPAPAAPADAPPPMRPSQVMIDAVASDTMEFAVREAVSALPFRDRVKGRDGSVEILTFRVGSELFGTGLVSVDEALELDQVTFVPEMHQSMLGVFTLRGRLVPIYSPARVLGVPLAGRPAATLVLHNGERLLGIAVDDIDDVIELDLSTVRDAPGLADSDGVLLGVARHGRDLIAIIDAESLVAACLSDAVAETA